MGIRFDSILVPVDFSVNTEVAVSRALEISHAGNSHLHLFHVQPVFLPNIPYLHYSVSGNSRRPMSIAGQQAEKKLLVIKRHIENISPGISVSCSIKFGEPVEQAIAREAVGLRADLIIIGKHSHHSILPFLNTVVPSRLAASSGSAILTAKPGSLNTEIKTVVIPVGNHYPGKKLEILEALRKKTRMQVRLVTFQEDENDPSFSRQSLLNTFRSLKMQCTHPVDYEVLQGNNKARALLKYCNKVGADMLIVHPESETRVDGWMKRYISDLLPADSKTQVLAVQPA